MNYNIICQIGRWQTTQDYKIIPDLSEETLRQVAENHWNSHPRLHDVATQVLIWKDGPMEKQTLIAVLMLEDSDFFLL